MEEKRTDIQSTVLLPMADKSQADALADIMWEQAAIMGTEEQREMLAFMRGVIFGRTLGRRKISIEATK